MIRINSRCPGQVYETVQEDSVQYEAGLGDDTFEYQYGEDEEKYEDEANDTLMDEEQPNGATSPMRRTPISMRSTRSWRPQARDWAPLPATSVFIVAGNRYSFDSIIEAIRIQYPAWTGLSRHPAAVPTIGSQSRGRGFAGGSRGRGRGGSFKANGRHGALK